MNKPDPQTFFFTSNAGNQSVTTCINQACAAESPVLLQCDTNLREHHMVMAKSRDGMGGDFRAPVPSESRATGLLANLMRRI